MLSSWPARPNLTVTPGWFFWCDFLWPPTCLLSSSLTGCFAAPETLLALFLPQGLCTCSSLCLDLWYVSSFQVCSSMSLSPTAYLKLELCPAPSIPPSLPHLPAFFFSTHHLWILLIYLLSLSPKMNVSSMKAGNFACFIDGSPKPRQMRAQQIFVIWLTTRQQAGEQCELQRPRDLVSYKVQAVALR